MPNSTLEDVAKELKRKMREKPLNLAPSGTYKTSTVCKPDCDICGGNGHYSYDVPVHHAEFGKLHLCPNVNIAKLLGQASGLDVAERNYDWDMVWGIENTGNAVDAIKRVLNRGYGWVYLYGGFGNAKTLILKIAVAQFLNTKGKAVYVRMLDVIDHLREAYLENDAASARVEFWRRIPLLAIDEIEKIKATEYAGERRFALMDKRYEDALRRTSITLLASNQIPDQLPGELADRILDGRFEIVHLTGESVRPAMRWEDTPHLDRGEQERLF